MLKYKVGDKVKIRKDLIVGETYGRAIFVKSMSDYVGHTLTIHSLRGDYYLVGGNCWSWTDNMLEDNTNKYKVDMFK